MKSMKMKFFRFLIYIIGFSRKFYLNLKRIIVVGPRVQKLWPFLKEKTLNAYISKNIHDKVIGVLQNDTEFSTESENSCK